MKGCNPLQALRYYDIIKDINSNEERYPLLCQSLQQNQKPLFTRELHSVGIQTQRTGQIRATIDLMLNTLRRALRRSTLRYGKMLTGLFRRVTRYTIRTATHQITHWTIWSVLHQRNMQHIMQSTCLLNDWSNLESTSRKYVTLPLSGISPKLGGHGIENWASLAGKVQNSTHSLVNTAVKNIHPETGVITSPAIVLTTVKPRHVVNLDWIMSTAHALDAGKISSSISTVLRDIAHASVLSAHEETETDYSLTKKDATNETFNFVRGVLLRTLDALRYLIAYFDLIPSTVAYSNRIY
jgi:hypothetical protein